MVHVLLRSTLFWNITQLVMVMLFPMLKVLYIYISTFRIMCAVSDMAVFCCSSILFSPGKMLRYYLNDSEMASFAPIITGNTSVFALHMRCFSIVIYLYMRIFSVSFYILPLIAEYDVRFIFRLRSVGFHLLSIIIIT